MRRRRSSSQLCEPVELRTSTQSIAFSVAHWPLDAGYLDASKIQRSMVPDGVLSRQACDLVMEVLRVELGISKVEEKFFVSEE